MSNAKKELARKNKILAIMLGIIALLSLSGAILWFVIYAPQVLYR
jgi:hypothetical protein